MVVGILHLDLKIHECNSLKAKRGCVRQLLGKVKTRFEVAAAEVGHQDLWQRAQVGVAIVGNDRAVINQKLDHVLNFVDKIGTAEVVNHHIELLNV